LEKPDLGGSNQKKVIRIQVFGLFNLFKVQLEFRSFRVNVVLMGGVSDTGREINSQELASGTMQSMACSVAYSAKPGFWPLFYFNYLPIKAILHFIHNS